MDGPGKPYKKGQSIERTCWGCYRREMKIYRVSKNPHGAFIWCECEKCGSVDDIILPNCDSPKILNQGRGKVESTKDASRVFKKSR